MISDFGLFVKLMRRRHWKSIESKGKWEHWQNIHTVMMSHLTFCQYCQCWTISLKTEFWITTINPFVHFVFAQWNNVWILTLTQTLHLNLSSLWACLFSITCSTVLTTFSKVSLNDFLKIKLKNVIPQYGQVNSTEKSQKQSQHESLSPLFLYLPVGWRWTI